MFRVSGGVSGVFRLPPPAFRLGLAQHNDTQRGEEVVASQQRANLDAHIHARGQRFMRASVLETRQDDQRQSCVVHLHVQVANFFCCMILCNTVSLAKTRVSAVRRSPREQNAALVTGRPVEFQGRMSSPRGPISGTTSVHHGIWRRARCTLGRRITAPCRRRPSLSPARRCLVRRDGQNRHDEPAGEENIANTLEESQEGFEKLRGLGSEAQHAAICHSRRQATISRPSR